jgi:hypothetical protein
VQEEQGAPTAFNRTGIMRFPVGKQEDAVALVFAYNRLGIFSDMLHPQVSSFSIGFYRSPYMLLSMGI